MSLFFFANSSTNCSTPVLSLKNHCARSANRPESEARGRAAQSARRVCRGQGGEPGRASPRRSHPLRACHPPRKPAANTTRSCHTPDCMQAVISRRISPWTRLEQPSMAVLSPPPPLPLLQVYYPRKKQKENKRGTRIRARLRFSICLAELSRAVESRVVAAASQRVACVTEKID